MEAASSTRNLSRAGRSGRSAVQTPLPPRIGRFKCLLKGAQQPKGPDLAHLLPCISPGGTPAHQAISKSDVAFPSLRCFVIVICFMTSWPALPEKWVNACIPAIGEFCRRDFHPRNNMKFSGTVCSPPRGTRGSLSLSPGQPSIPRPPGRLHAGHTRAVSPVTKAKQVPRARDTAPPTARPPFQPP